MFIDLSPSSIFLDGRVYLLTLFIEFDRENWAGLGSHRDGLFVSRVWIDDICLSLLFIELEDSWRNGDAWGSTDTHLSIDDNLHLIGVVALRDVSELYRYDCHGSEFREVRASNSSVSYWESLGVVSV